jgi:hypothetical protein
MAAVLAESPAGVASSATGRFEVGYITEDGAEHRVRLDEAWLVPLERALPVPTISPMRKFSSDRTK